jgi:hypothetical protein
MFLALKSIRWFEWMFLGVVITVALWGYVNSERIKSLIKENAEVTTNYNVEKENSTRKTESYAISEEVVTEFVKDLVDAQFTQQRSREEVLNEYIVMARRSHSGIDEPVARPVDDLPGEDGSEAAPAPLSTIPRPKVPSPPITAPSSSYVAPDRTAGLLSLAKRMRERYCSAQYGNATCPTE